MGAIGAMGASGASGADLDAWSSFPWAHGLQLPDLHPLAALEIRTKNTTYEITVTDPRNGDVLVRGGTYFPVHTRARLAGASLSGSFLKLLGIYVGFSMELHTDEGPIVTTRVREIAVARPSALPS